MRGLIRTGGGGTVPEVVTTQTQAAGDYETQETSITSANDFDTDIATSRIKITPTAGYDRLVISFKDAGSAAVNLIYVAFNSASDAAANTALGLEGARTPIAIGDEFEIFFPADGLCTRIDIYTPDTETGAALVSYLGRY